MSPSAVRRAAPAALATPLGVLALLLAQAAPAAAHTVEGGSLPAPPWLLAYTGSFAVLIAAVVLRARRLTPRPSGVADLAADDATAPAPAASAPGLHAGHVVGSLLFALALGAAVAGPDSAAANVAPVAVLVVWWVCLPIACLLLGDVMSRVNPFQLPVAALSRFRRDDTATEPAPSWTSAAFLASFAWFFLAYHSPGSPRALAVYLALYALAAVAGGLLWGRGWLSTGEGFAGLSAAVARLSWRRTDRRRVPGLAPLMVVLLGATAFDAVTSTPFWIDVVGTSRGWSATLLDTVGLVWITAIVAGAYLLAVRAVQREPGPARGGLAAALALSLVPLALAWFLAHDITLLLVEGQNFVILVSDPLGRGWDLFGTVEGFTPDFTIVRDRWVRWLQLALLAVGHVGAVVVAHEVALRLRPPRAAVRITWALAVVSAASMAVAVLLVLG